MKYKQFLDTVHGYIYIDDDLCTKLIDTVYFQRLRRIEQTSSRSLFPCAHHDRFVHSIGVYYIGQRIIRTLNQKHSIPVGIIKSYEIACLLHDCGHSPFSHTLEDQFGNKKKLFNAYVEELKKHEIDKDIWGYDIRPSDAKHHEIISAYLCITVFYESIIQLGGNPALVGRMIMGISYDTDEKSLDDCFISLLHGDVIDADRMDYVCRDKWALGYLSNAVDLERLISAIILKRDGNRYHIAYRKNAITEIQALIDSKNFQNAQIFSHHQVVYEQELLKKSVQELIDLLDPEDKNPTKLFNYKAFISPQKVNDKVEVYLPTDDDIIHLMKQYINTYKPFKEWLSRNYDYIPLWKSRAEFIALFKDYDSKFLLSYTEKELFGDIIKPEVEKYLQDGEKCICLAGNATYKTIRPESILIDFDGKELDYTDLNLLVCSVDPFSESFKYLFIPKTYENKKNKLIEKIKTVLPKKGKSGV